MTKRIRIIGMVAAALTILTGTVSAYSAETKTIKFNEFGVDRAYVCEAETVAEFLDEKQISLNDTDKIYLNDEAVSDMDSELKSGDTISLKKSYVVKVVIDGEESEVETAGGTVEDIEKMYADKLGENYEFKSGYAKTAPLRNNMELVFETTKQTVETVTNEIPFETEYVENPDLEKGKENIIQQGVNTIKTYTYYKTYVGGKYTDIKEKCEIVQEGKKQIVEKGTKEVVKAPAAASSAGTIDGLKYKKTISMNSSAYTAYCSGTKRRTATGAEAVKGVAAVDTNVIPFGTKLYIPGYGYAVAADRGGAIKGNRIDLCMNSYNEAIQWGRRNVTVYILE